MSTLRQKTLLLLLLISSAPFVKAQATAPGFDPMALEIRPVAKTTPRPITSLDLLTIRDITGIQISPDGKSVAYVVSQAILDSNSYRTALFIVSTEPGSVPVNLGSAGPPRWDGVGQYIKTAPKWSPDSRYITYLVGEKDKRQIWMWSREGGNPEQVTHNASDVDSYEWQADGKRIFFTTVEPITLEEIKRISEQGILYDSYTNLDFWASIRPGENRPIAMAALNMKPRKRQTWIYDFATKIERRLTPEEDSEYIKLHQPQIRPKAGDKSYIAVSKPSPDGKQIAYVSVLNDPSKSSTYMYTISIKDLATNHSYELVPPSREYIFNLLWSKESDKVFFIRDTGDGGQALYAIPARGGAVSEIVKGSKDILTAYSFDENMLRVACLRESPTVPPEVAVLELRNGGVRTLVNVNPEFQNIMISSATKLEWTNKYGDYAFGYLIKPLNYEPGRRYPLVVTSYSARGFLRGNVGDEYPAQVLAANNLAVLCIDLFAANLRIPKPGDFKEWMRRFYSPIASLEQATRTLDEMGIIDSRRKGLAGLSYGSEVTHFAISHSDLFQAAVVSSGTSRDPIFYYLTNGYWHKTFAQLGLGGLPEGKAAERWLELSAALNATRIQAPLLINSADSEYIQGLQLYTSLKELGKPVELFIYADEGHIKNQPKHRYEVYQRNVDWFNFWLQNKEDPDLSKGEQYTRWRAMRNAMNSNRTASQN